MKRQISETAPSSAYYLWNLNPGNFRQNEHEILREQEVHKSEIGFRAHFRGSSSRRVNGGKETLIDH